MQYKPISLPPDQAQFIQTQKLNVLDISRAFRVPPHKISDLERSTFSNIEHQSIEFVTDCIRPLCTKLEQEFNRKLLFENDKGRKYFEFNLNGLLRGDAKTRAEYYNKLFQIGAMSQNEIRSKENLNSIGPLGDKLYVPMNMAAIDEVSDEQE
jgi:HK97 family phage portal protein